MTASEPGPRSEHAGRVINDVLAAATAEILEQRRDDISLRSVARRVGVSHQALSHYFANRRALLTAVAVQGLEDLQELSVEAVQAVGDSRPGSKTVAIGVCYVDFARARRPVFDLMVNSRHVDEGAPALLAARHELWVLLVRTVKLDVANGWGGGVQAETMAALAYSIVHGLAMLGNSFPGETDVNTVLNAFNKAILTSN